MNPKQFHQQSEEKESRSRRPHPPGTDQTVALSEAEDHIIYSPTGVIGNGSAEYQISRMHARASQGNVHVMANHIGRVQGNMHLQRMIHRNPSRDTATPDGGSLVEDYALSGLGGGFGTFAFASPPGDGSPTPTSKSANQTAPTKLKPKVRRNKSSTCLMSRP